MSGALSTGCQSQASQEVDLSTETADDAMLESKFRMISDSEGTQKQRIWLSVWCDKPAVNFLLQTEKAVFGLFLEKQAENRKTQVDCARLLPKQFPRV